MNTSRVLNSRTLRLVVGATALGGSIWALSPYMLYRVAPVAYVNAELTRVSAPIAGHLARELPQKGQFIHKSRELSLVEAYQVDRRHTFDLARQLQVARDKSELARRHLNEIERIDRELGERVEIYRASMINRLQQEQGEAVAAEALCNAELLQRRYVGTAMREMARRGIASGIRSSEAIANQEAAGARCVIAGAKVKRIEVELAAAIAGVFLSEGANDTPYSQQHRDRLVLRKHELEAELFQETSRAQQLSLELQAEQLRVDQLARAEITLPAQHVVWSLSASPGSAVTEGQSVLDLADCRRRFLTVELPERDFENVREGEQALVRLIGSDVWQSGVVNRVRGSAARADDRLLAAQIPRGNQSSIAVEVELPPDLNTVDSTGFCAIGRLAEVRFGRLQKFSLMSWVRSLMNGSFVQLASGAAQL